MYKKILYHFKTLICFLLFCLPQLLLAEGTEQIDPSATDYTKLMTNNGAYGSFAQYDGAVNSRLFIHIEDPSTEIVYLGFSKGAEEQFDVNGYYLGDNLSVDYYFRIKSADGTIVYGPTLINNSSTNLSSRADAISGPAPITGSGGYTPFIFNPTGLAAGDYYIEFSDQANSLATISIDIPFFDITVAANNTAINGRLWSYNWAFKTTPTLNSGTSPYSNFDRAFNGEVYAYTDDGFVNKLNFANSGFRGWFFTISFNANGTGSTGDVALDRKSVPNAYSVSPQYKIFLNDPDQLVYPSGILGYITTDPEVNVCTPTDPCVWIETTKEGQVEILLDFEQSLGAGLYDAGTSDVLLLECIMAEPGEQPPYRRCVEWDGKDGFETSVNLGSNIDVYAKLQQGVTHYGAFDVEYVVDGYSIDIVRPAGANFVSNLYYDDTDIPFMSGDGSSQEAINGCSAPCHSWINFDYGNLNSINTWWISHTSNFDNLHIPWCVPTAKEDTVYTAVNTAILIDVLSNDKGTALLPSTVTVNSQPSNGIITVDPMSGDITYSPNAGFVGEDRFWYEVCNADPICDDTWVIINVNGITAINDDNNTLVNLGVSGNVLTNDVDNEGDVISINTTAYANPTNGGVVIMTDGSYTYTPTTDFVGQDQFLYIICDNAVASACDTATVVITITDEPSFSNNEVIANADEAITNTDIAISSNVLANDADVDGDNLTVNTTPLSLPTNGVVTISGNGDFIYTPANGFVGQDQFTYEVCDDGIPQACASTIVKIDVIPDLNGPAPNAPFAGDDFEVTNVNVSVSGDLSTNDFGGGIINTAPMTPPTNGSVVINANGNFTYAPNTSFIGWDQFVYVTSGVSTGNSTTHNYTSNDIPINITDNTVTSTLQISNGGQIADVNITNLNINHTWVSDLSISITSPAGTTVDLFSALCGNNVPGYNLDVDDEGTALAVCGDLVDGLAHRATHGILETFDGESSNGTWTLTISDSFSGDVGVLNSWGLEIETFDLESSQATAYILVLPPPVTDLDEDNDGIPDLQEVFTGDHDNDGVLDYEDADFCIATFQGVNGWDCSNGLPDPDFDLDGDSTPNIVDVDYPYSIPDTDLDGFYDYVDLDADNDGIPDLIEAGGTDVNGDGLVDTPTDSDHDGLVDSYDPVNGLNPGMYEGTALDVVNTDADDFPNYLDLDSDNDGIPDLIESGGIDSQGDGIVDDLSDSDSDGYVNSHDPLNASNAGSNEGTPHFITGADSGDGTPVSNCLNCDNDGDQLPPYVDLDADNDGILDIIEAGGEDSNNDGMIDDAVGDNGYSNGLDPEDGGTPYFTTDEDVMDDVDSRPEYTSTAGIGDSDADDVPDFLDVDSDNDGIYDNYEAQTTLGYVSPENMESDGDGIDDAYDAQYSAASNGINPYNHDSMDEPDYLDLDSDNDNIPDWQEAWDHVFDGDSQADNLASNDNLDSDGDGLLDVFDANDGSAGNVSWEGDPANDIDGNNGSMAGTVFTDNLLILLPENGGNDLAQPDYRDQLIDCGTPLVYYGLSEMGGSTAQYAYNKVTEMHELNAATGEVRATNYCTRDGWYYYFNPLEPTNYLFAVKYNDLAPGIIPIEELIDYVEIRLDSNPTGRQVGNGANANYVLARDWHVVFKGTPNVGATYDIKFYFDPQEMMDLDAAADAVSGTYGARTLKWFKADQGAAVSFNPSDIAADSIANMQDITAYANVVVDENNGIASTDGTGGMDAGNGKNYVSFSGLPGFSGGTAVLEMSASLPVELQRFEGKNDNCEIQLFWDTETEINASHFEIERSQDGKIFTAVNTVQTMSNEQGNSYFYADYPVPGSYYYRLKSVDYNAEFSYSSVIQLANNCFSEAQEIKVFPNPVYHEKGSEITVVCSTQIKDPVFEIININGRIVQVKKVMANEGLIRTSFDLSSLPAGTYFLRSKEIGMEYTQKILKID